MEWSSTLDAAANLIVLVLLPLVLFIFRHIARMHATFQTELKDMHAEFRGEIKDVHVRVTEAHDHAKAVELQLAQRYLPRDDTRMMIEQHQRTLEAKIDSLSAGTERIEKWLAKVSDHQKKD